MAVQIEHEPITNQATPQASSQRSLRLFTVDEYYKMAEMGILGPDERIELIEGVIVKMSPIGSRHGGCVKTLNSLLGELKGKIAIVSVQDPLDIDGYSEPEPDVALLKFRPDNYRESHPTPADVLLLIEVSDTTLATDRGVKVPLYAGAAIPVYWIVDLQNNAIEVYSNPADGQYTKFERVSRGRALEVPGIPNATVNVDDILG